MLPPHTHQFVWPSGRMYWSRRQETLSYSKQLPPPPAGIVWPSAKHISNFLYVGAQSDGQYLTWQIDAGLAGRPYPHDKFPIVRPPAEPIHDELSAGGSSRESIVEALSATASSPHTVVRPLWGLPPVSGSPIAPPEEDRVRRERQPIPSFLSVMHHVVVNDNGPIVEAVDGHYWREESFDDFFISARQLAQVLKCFKRFSIWDMAAFGIIPYKKEWKRDGPADAPPFPWLVYVFDPDQCNIRLYEINTLPEGWYLEQIMSVEDNGRTRAVFMLGPKNGVYFVPSVDELESSYCRMVREPIGRLRNFSSSGRQVELWDTNAVDDIQLKDWILYMSPGGWPGMQQSVMTQWRWHSGAPPPTMRSVLVNTQVLPSRQYGLVLDNKTRLANYTPPAMAEDGVRILLPIITADTRQSAIDKALNNPTPHLLDTPGSYDIIGSSENRRAFLGSTVVDYVWCLFPDLGYFYRITVRPRLLPKGWVITTQQFAASAAASGSQGEEDHKILVPDNPAHDWKYPSVTELWALFESNNFIRPTTKENRPLEKNPAVWFWPMDGFQRTYDEFTPLCWYQHFQPKLVREFIEKYR